REPYTAQRFSSAVIAFLPSPEFRVPMTIRRIGCVGDLHGALGSLLKVLEHLRNAEVEGILFTGDFARGPFNRDPALGNTAPPDELLRVVTSASANVLLVPGNHDDPTLGGGVSVDGRETSWRG